jgi:hypothetical protein
VGMVVKKRWSPFRGERFTSIALVRRNQLPIASKKLEQFWLDALAYC